MADQRQGPGERFDPDSSTGDANPDAPFSPSKVKALYNKGLQAQRFHSHEYWLNHAFMSGHQWLYVDSQTRTINELPRDPDRYQAVFNRLAHSTRSIMSKYTQRQLAFEVLPDEATDTAMTGAKVAESILGGISKDHDWETKREILGRAAWKGGTAALCVDWDANAGDRLFDSGMTAPEGEDLRETLNEGDSVETVLSLAEFVLQPGARDGERGDWWIKAQAMPPETVKDQFSLKRLPPADATAGLTPFHAKLLASHTSPDGHEEQVDLTLVLTYYERPNAHNDKGRVAVVVGDEFVDGPKDWPFPWTDRLNIAIHRETIDETRSLGDTVLSQARGPQVAYNAAWSNFLEHLKNAGNARLMVDSTTLDILDSLTDLPGEYLPIQTGTTPPAWLAPAQLENGLFKLIEEIRIELDDILGIHDVSRGNAPPNIESGFGLSILAEQDNSPVGRMVKDSATVWEKVASMVLKLYEDNTDHERKTTISRDNYGPKTVTWDGGALAGQTDVSIPLDGILPRSRAAQMAVSEKLVQMGLITDLEMAMKVAELPGQKDIIAAVNPDTSRARRENYRMSRGHPAIVEVYDNHAIHILEHTNELKNTDWEGHPNPDAKDLFLTHLQGHETMAAEAAGAAQARSQISPLMATVPNAQGIPTIDPAALPPGSVTDAQGLPPQPEVPPEGEVPAAPGGPGISDMDPAQVAAMEG